MTIIGTDDIGRIATEIMHSIDEDASSEYREEAEDWAERQGMEREVMPMICNSIRAAHEEALAAALKQQAARSEDSEVVEVDGVEMIEADSDILLWSMEVTILSAFRWGWESAKQYATRTEVPE